MTIAEFQTWLNAHGAKLKADGVFGPQSRAALFAVFSNKAAKSVSPFDIAAFAKRLCVSEKQLKAVAAIESGGAGFDREGRPSILFERHYFHRLTDGKYSPTVFSDPKSGGYLFPSWEKLALACSRNVDSAFASASWGKFQIMGAHWHKLGYASPLEMAYSMVGSEAAHYEALCRYVEVMGLRSAMQAISTDPKTCIAFARGYNGPQYRKYDYDVKLANAMKIGSTK